MYCVCRTPLTTHFTVPKRDGRIVGETWKTRHVMMARNSSHSLIHHASRELCLASKQKHLILSIVEMANTKV